MRRILSVAIVLMTFLPVIGIADDEIAVGRIPAYSSVVPRAEFERSFFTGNFTNYFQGLTSLQ